MSDIKKVIEDDFEKVKKLSVEEYTLYRKWEEVNKEWSIKELQRMHEIKNSIWIPESPDDYLELDPAIIPATDINTNLTWILLRVFTSTMHWNPSPGRMLRFFVQDRKTKGYLGVISLGSDFISIGGRDSYIGWTREHRLKHKMLNYTAMGSSIVPTQPLGYNYTGGKLMALLTVSDIVENTWNERYKEPLVGVSTTSLYGGLSQYNRLRYWKKCKSTDGQIPLEPSEECYTKIREWMRANHRDKLKVLQARSHPKTAVLMFVYKTLKIKPPINNFSRGVYFSELYTNTRPFLRRDHEELADKKFDNSVNTLIELWKERYAKNRLKSLIDSGRYSEDKLFYNQLIGREWEDVRQEYIQEVGR